MNNEIVPADEEQLVFQGDPWDRQPGEPTRLYDRFTIFLRLGMVRSMRACYRQWRRAQDDPTRWATGLNPVRAPESWMEASRTWNWKERASEWDMHLLDKEEELWMGRRENLRNLEFALSEELIERARDLLNWPLASESHPALDEDGKPMRGRDGEPIFREISPSKWTLGDAVRMITAGTELRRRATGTDISVSAVINIPWGELTKDQLRRIAAGEDYEQILLEG